MTVPDVPGLVEAISRLRELLDRAREVKESRSINPPLPASEFIGASGLVTGRSHFVAVELAARQIFEELVVQILVFPYER